MDRRETAEVRIDRVLGDGPFAEAGRPSAIDHSPDGEVIVVGGRVLAVYRADDLSCVHRVETDWPINVIACHPTLPMAVIGTGNYDGGWSYRGELLHLDLVTGAVVSLLTDLREVRDVSWRNPWTLDLVLAITHDEAYGAHGSTWLTCAIRRYDWDQPTAGMVEVPRWEYPISYEPRDRAAEAAAELGRIGRSRGLDWVPRPEVRALEALPHNRILATLDGVLTEVDLGTGAVLSRTDVPLLTRHDLGRLDVRHAPGPLLLEPVFAGVGVRQWVAGPGGPLFPYDWEQSRPDRLAPGPGVYVEDRAGPAIVHVASSGYPHRTLVARRAYPTGELQWTFRTDVPVAALDIGDGLLFLAFGSGTLAIFRAEDGALLGRHWLRVAGLPVTPLSLVRSGLGRIAVGLKDGRILDCSVTRHRSHPPP